jgi:hypothetical protein
MRRTKELNQYVYKYILEAIDPTVYNLNLHTDKEKLEFLYDTFKREYSYMINQVGQVNAMREWIMGLPSSFNIEFKNNEILKLAVLWQSIPENYTDKEADKIINNWFNFVAVKTFQLFRKHKVGGC